MYRLAPPAGAVQAGKEIEIIMLDKSNIIGIINAHQEEIDELKAEIPSIKNDSAKRAVQNRIAYLEDNQYRYKLQARAWGMDV